MRALMPLALFAFTSIALAAPIGVYVQRVQPVAFADELEALGTLRANESVELTANTSERIVAIHFRDGERVAKGQLLVELNAAEERAQREELALVTEEAERQYQRVQRLAKDGLAPQSQLDQQRREHLAAQARLDAVDARLADLAIVAPFAGQVGIRTISVGALVKPGDLISNLDDDSVMKLDFSVPATYLPALRPGLQIRATARALENAEFEGEIASIDSRVDPVTRAIRVRALIPNPEHRLKPGLLMSLRLYKNPRQALVLAEEALIPEGRDNYVLQLDADQARVRKVPVTVGARVPGRVEILTGLEAGALVVTHGTLKLRDGAEIAVLAEQQPGERLQDLLRKRAAQQPGQGR